MYVQRVSLKAGENTEGVPPPSREKKGVYYNYAHARLRPSSRLLASRNPNLRPLHTPRVRRPCDRAGQAPACLARLPEQAHAWSLCVWLLTCASALRERPAADAHVWSA